MGWAAHRPASGAILLICSGHADCSSSPPPGAMPRLTHAADVPQPCVILCPRAGDCGLPGASGPPAPHAAYVP